MFSSIKIIIEPLIQTVTRKSSETMNMLSHDGKGNTLVGKGKGSWSDQDFEEVNIGSELGSQGTLAIGDSTKKNQFTIPRNRGSNNS